MNIVNKKELAEIFNCSFTTVANWKNCPKYGWGKWDADEVAKYIIETFRDGKVKNAAKRYIANSVSITVEKDSPKQAKDANNLKLSPDSGLIGMMSRLRDMELTLSKYYLNSKDGDTFNQWMKICAELAKAEKQFDEIMLRRGAVVGIDDAKAYFFEKIIPMKQQFKSFGSDTCQDVAIMDDPKEVKRYLDEKIMKIMQGMTE